MLQGSQEGAGESEAEARTRSALELAHAALAEAQVSAENLQRLPSAQEPWQVPHALSMQCFSVLHPRSNVERPCQVIIRPHA